MEQKKYKIDNTNYLVLDGDNTEIHVLNDTAYLFIVEKLENGLTGARHEIGFFKAGEACRNISGNEKYDIIITGSCNTEIEVVPATDPDNLKNCEYLRNQIIESLEKTLADAAKRSVQLQKLNDASFKNTLLNIASVVNKKASEKIVYEETDAPIIKAFKIAASYMDITVSCNEGMEYSADKAGLQQLAKDNTVRVRQIILRDKWYKEDNGYLVGFYNPNGPVKLEDEDEKNRIPVALIHKGDFNYVIVDPSTDRQIPVNSSNVCQIYPMAFMIYKSLPNETITIKKIIKFVLKDIKKDLLRFILISLMCTLIGLLIPEITRNFIDHVIPQASKNVAVQICVLVFMCNIAQLFGEIAKHLATTRMDTKADADLEAAMIDRLLKLPVNFFKKQSSGEITSRALSVTQIRASIFGIIMSVGMGFLFSIIYLIQEFRYSAYFAKWSILFCIIPVLVSVLVCVVSYKFKVSLLKSQGKISGMLFQFLSGIEKISNSNSERPVFQQWSKEYIRQTKIGYKLAKISIFSTVVNAVFPILVSVAFYFLFGKGIKDGTIDSISTGTFMAFLSAFGSFQSSVVGVAGSLLQITDVISQTKYIKPILQEKTEVEEAKPPVTKLKGDIEVSHLSFRYDPNGPLILDDVCIDVKQGEFIAIVGSSGAGKSTLLRLLLGFEKPESGSIFYDSQDITSVDISSLRRKMGVVLQNDTIMQGSVLQNIIGSSGLKEEDAWIAAKKVGFDQDISNMPMGMMTMLPAGGLTLSGGQLQRLIIARAIIRNPNILIFDEATSSLDNMTQLIVRQSLDELNVTRIIIAHRLSTIINADRIYVMENGKVVETGNYQELMALNGLFAKLAKRQNL